MPKTDQVKNMFDKRLLKLSINKFSLNLNNKTVLTEAATGNYVVTSVIAALSCAKVYAFTKNSSYGSIENVKNQTYHLAEDMGVKDKITIIEDLNELNLRDIDIVTNTGFLRPINREFISQLSSECVIPLMWEPWECRKGELDLDACHEYGIKVYGTNESDERLRTMEYIGYTVLCLLLNNGLSPFSSNVLLVGCHRFTNPVERILKQNNYETLKVTDYSSPVNAKEFKSIIVLEHERDILVIGGNSAFINKKELDCNTLVIHVCGNVSFNNARFKFVPNEPAAFGHMSFTTDYVDNMAVIDLHTAGLKVAEGMLSANSAGLKGEEYKLFMEKNYPALGFDDQKYW